MIKPEYYSWGSAPMRFYHVHCKLVLLACVFSIISCFSNISLVVSALNEYDYSVSGVLILIYVSIVSLLSVVLLAISANGLKRQQWLGVRAWCAAMLLPAANSVVCGCLGFSQWPEVCGSVLGILIVFFPIYVYYQKRRPLFAASKLHPEATPKQEVTPKLSQSQIFTEGGQTIMPEFAAPPIKRPAEKKALPTRPVMALLVVVCVVCVASIAGNIIQWNDRQTETAELHETIAALQKQLESTQQTEGMDREEFLRRRENGYYDISKKEEPSTYKPKPYVSSSNSDKYHYFFCPHAYNILKGNRVDYETKADAERDGKSPCSLCKP